MITVTYARLLLQIVLYKKVLPEPFGPLEALNRFCVPQPKLQDNGHGPVYCTVCLFTPQLILPGLPN